LKLEEPSASAKIAAGETSADGSASSESDVESRRQTVSLQQGRFAFDLREKHLINRIFTRQQALWKVCIKSKDEELIQTVKMSDYAKL